MKALCIKKFTILSASCRGDQVFSLGDLYIAKKHPYKRKVKIYPEKRSGFFITFRNKIFREYFREVL